MKLNFNEDQYEYLGVAVLVLELHDGPIEIYVPDQPGRTLQVYALAEKVFVLVDHEHDTGEKNLFSLLTKASPSRMRWGALAKKGYPLKLNQLFTQAHGLTKTKVGDDVKRSYWAYMTAEHLEMYRKDFETPAEAVKENNDTEEVTA